MRAPRPLLTLALLAALCVGARTSAAGGAFLREGGDVKITGHRMALAITSDSTTLWDQLTFEGDTTALAWVLPVKAPYEVGLSAEAVFRALDGATPLQIDSPRALCDVPPTCDGSPTPGAQEILQTSYGFERPSTRVIGPYELVHLGPEDPSALTAWLGEHGYAVPDEIAPVIAAYLAEGYGFLGVRLLLAHGPDATRPLRVSGAGVAPVVPLRMLAAGAAEVIPLDLWVIAEQPSVPMGVDTFTIAADDLTWSWDAQSSDFPALLAQRFADSGGLAWNVQPDQAVNAGYLAAQADGWMRGHPERDYAGDRDSRNGSATDLALLEAPCARGRYCWLTRMRAELTPAALAADPTIAASDEPFKSSLLETTATTGTLPCPTPAPCPPPGAASGGVFTFDDGDGGCGCALHTRHATWPWAAFAALAWLASRRRGAGLGAAPASRRTTRSRLTASCTAPPRPRPALEPEPAEHRLGHRRSGATGGGMARCSSSPIMEAADDRVEARLAALYLSALIA
jgi:hypothetical protein